MTCLQCVILPKVFRGTHAEYKSPNGKVWFHDRLAWTNCFCPCHQQSALALTSWVFEEARSATALGLMQVFFITPLLIITPFAGVMVDRHNRKLIMQLSDLMAGLATIVILVLQAFGVLELDHHMMLTAETA